MKNLICRIWYTFYVMEKMWKTVFYLLIYPVLISFCYILYVIIPPLKEKGIRQYGTLKKAMSVNIENAKRTNGMDSSDYTAYATFSLGYLYIFCFFNVLFVLSAIFNMHFMYNILLFCGKMFLQESTFLRYVSAIFLVVVLTLLPSIKIPYLTYDTQTYEAYLRQFRKCSKLENLKWHTVSLFIIISTLVFGLAGMYILFVIMQDKMSSYEAVKIFFHQLF